MGQAVLEKLTGGLQKIRAGRGAGFPVDAHHLLGAGHDPGLAGGAPLGLGQEPGGLHPQPGHLPAQEASRVVVAHQAQDLHPGPQGHQVVDHVAGASQGAGLPLHVHHGHRRLGGDALHPAPEVLIQHEIPGHQDPQGGEGGEVQVAQVCLDIEAGAGGG